MYYTQIHSKADILDPNTGSFVAPQEIALYKVDRAITLYTRNSPNKVGRAINLYTRNSPNKVGRAITIYIRNSPKQNRPGITIGINKK